VESNAQKLAFLGMPGYGQPTAGASQGFWLCSGGGLRVRRCYQSGSLLAQNFNALWCAALTLKGRDGEPIEYFAMQHDDIEPEMHWLDKLVAEMEANNLDVLGVVSPIKDQNGLTSIALHDPDGDNWAPKCRLTMREVCGLPETFTSKDVGYPLLLNTGLWVCRLNMDWADQVHFTINDRIVLDRKTGAYKAQVESEDWFFSRLLHELGLRVGCTRKVSLAHVGRMKFGNNTPWGSQDFDSDMIAESVIGRCDLELPKASSLPADTLLET